MGIKLGSVLLNYIPMEWNFYARYTEYAILGIGVGLTLPLYKGLKKVMVILFGCMAGILIYII
jgi:hypothetical protein